jgi:alkylation response protein AidB-like acyl-CoA dehydrogenase
MNLNRGRALVESLVSSLILAGTAEHGPAASGGSSLLSDTVRHEQTRARQPDQTTQIYEGTNQIQRIVIAKRLFG